MLLIYAVAQACVVSGEISKHKINQNIGEKKNALVILLGDKKGKFKEAATNPSNAVGPNTNKCCFREREKDFNSSNKLNL